MREASVPNRVNDEVMVKNSMLIGTIVHSHFLPYLYRKHFDACYAGNLRKVFSIAAGQNGLNIGQQVTTKQVLACVMHTAFIIFGVF